MMLGEHESEREAEVLAGQARAHEAEDRIAALERRIEELKALLAVSAEAEERAFQMGQESVWEAWD